MCNQFGQDLNQMVPDKTSKSYVGIPGASTRGIGRRGC